MWKVREQARLQVAEHPEQTDALRTPRSGAGCRRRWWPTAVCRSYPNPNEGDLFFDIEGDPFAFWEGLEYLFGVWETPPGTAIWEQDGYTGIWAYDEEARQFTREQEKQRIRAGHGPLHGAARAVPGHAHLPLRLVRAEPPQDARRAACDARGAARRAAARSSVRGPVSGGQAGRARRRGELLDQEARAPVRVQARDRARDANSSIVEFEFLLEEGDPDGRIKEKIRLYNRDDCISTEKLRDWLELRRDQAERHFGFELPRPPGEIEPPAAEFTARQQAVARARGTPDCFDRAGSELDRVGHRQGDVAACATSLDWHRRENKSAWWRFFELMSLSEDELVDEAEPIGQLVFDGIVDGGGTKKSDDYRYRFPAQEHKVEVGNEVYDPEITEGETRTGSVVASG